MTFEWDENKNSENIAKHKVSFEKAQDAFFDVNRIILEDVKHSVSEKRYFCIGKTDEGILTVRFTIRGKIYEFSAQDIGVKERNAMKNIYSDPEKSVMEALDSAVLVEDFLPSPSELVRKSTKEKITILIDSDCINFFKAEAKKNHTKYQTMMNEVLSQYAKHYTVTI